MEFENLPVQKSEQYLRLKNEIIPKIAESLGKNAGNLRCEIKVPNGSYFISTIYMVEMIFRNKSENETEIIKLVVKMQPEEISTRIYMRTDVLFKNEIIFYENFGKIYDDYPKCVFLISEPIDKAVLVMENAMQFGFKGIAPKQDLGMKRVLAAVKEIGKFHARSYVMKEKNAEAFFEVANKLEEVMFDYTANPAMIKFINMISIRPINYLNHVNYDPEFCLKMGNLMRNAHEKILIDCVKPVNELAVLCHGDFTSNNVLFRVKNNGEFKARLIDFAQLRYASPATDISTFLYLSCEEDVRKNFPLIFKTYHDAVIKYLQQEGVRDLRKYSYEAFLNDYKRHALIGCEIAIYFTPVMYLDYRVNFNDFVTNEAEHTKNLLVSGGNKISKKLADMIIEMRENGCLDHLI